MSWLLRGIQSAVFHYASCAPCIEYARHKKRRKQAKVDRKARMQLEKDQPGVYAHPEPTGTNPFWQEEIDLGPGPPPRRCKKSNTSSQRGIVRAGTHSTVVSQGSSSIDVNDPSRMSEDTLDDENWNHKRYQREDEHLWGLDESMLPVRPTATRSASLGFSSLTRFTSSKDSTTNYYAARAPPVNDLHPPVVSLPCPHPTGNQWMLQPPPNARVMSGKERATRSRSGSGASSRVELSVQRQGSTRQSKLRTDHGTPSDRPVASRRDSKIAIHRNESLQKVSARPPSASSSHKRQRRDTAWSMRTDHGNSSAGDSSDTIIQPKTLDGMHQATKASNTKPTSVPDIHILQIRSSRQRLSTVISSGDAHSPHHQTASSRENPLRQKYSNLSSTQSSDSMPNLIKHRTMSSDASSLNELQDLVTPRALSKNRFVSAPLTEARIQLPPSSADEDKTLTSNDNDWMGSDFEVGQAWDVRRIDGPVPFDSFGPRERDPTLRWSVDF